MRGKFRLGKMDLLAIPKSRTASIPTGEALVLVILISRLARAFRFGYGSFTHN
jgi:hypothetical protein